MIGEHREEQPTRTLDVRSDKTVNTDVRLDARWGCRDAADAHVRTPDTSPTFRILDGDSPPGVSL